MSFPCAHHVVSRWTLFGFPVDTMWFQGGQHMVSKVDTMWFPQDTTWFPHGCHVVSIWTPSVVEVTTQKPVQKTALHEANWLPCFICISPFRTKTPSQSEIFSIIVDWSIFSYVFTFQDHSTLSK